MWFFYRNYSSNKLCNFKIELDYTLRELLFFQENTTGFKFSLNLEGFNFNFLLCSRRIHTNDNAQRVRKSNKMRARHRDNLFLDETTVLLPSIQNAVDHFRKTMKRQKSNLIRLPSLIKGNEDFNSTGRIKYQHRSNEELTRNSENWDRLRYILHEENVSNSIDLVFEANKPTGSPLHFLECSPPLVSKAESDGINEYKNFDSDQKMMTKEKETLDDAIQAPGFKLTLGDLLNSDPGGSKESSRDQDPCKKTVDEEDKGGLIKPVLQSSVVNDDISFDSKDKKKIKVTLPTDDKPSKKKVRFNLETESPRNTNVKGNKSPKSKSKSTATSKPYGLSHIQETHYTSQRTKTGLAMKQMFKGQRRAQKT